MATLAPRSANARAMARPIRLAAPVTSTVFPLSSLSISKNREALPLWRGVWCVGRLLWSCLWRRNGCGWLSRRFGWPDGFLNTGLSCRRFALVVLIGRELLLRVNHGDGDRPAWFGHPILFFVGAHARVDTL